MLAPPRRCHGAPRQGAADSAATPGFVDGKGAEQQGRPIRSGADVPEPDRANNVAVVFGDKRKPIRRAAAFAQPFRGFLKTRRTPDTIEQIVTRVDIAETFVTDCHHGTLLPRSRGVVSLRRVDGGSRPQPAPGVVRCGSLNVERFQRREAVEGHGRVGRRIGAGSLDQHFVADLKAHRQRIGQLLVQDVRRIAGRAGEYARTDLAVTLRAGSGSGSTRPSFRQGRQICRCRDRPSVRRRSRSSSRRARPRPR